MEERSECRKSLQSKVLGGKGVMRSVKKGDGCLRRSVGFLYSLWS